MCVFSGIVCMIKSICNRIMCVCHLIITDYLLTTEWLYADDWCSWYDVSGVQWWQCCWDYCTRQCWRCRPGVQRSWSYTPAYTPALKSYLPFTCILAGSARQPAVSLSLRYYLFLIKVVLMVHKKNKNHTRRTATITIASTQRFTTTQNYLTSGINFLTQSHRGRSELSVVFFATQQYYYYFLFVIKVVLMVYKKE